MAERIIDLNELAERAGMTGPRKVTDHVEITMGVATRTRGRYAGLTDEEVEVWRQFYRNEPHHGSYGTLRDYKISCRMRRAEKKTES